MIIFLVVIVIIVAVGGMFVINSNKDEAVSIKKPEIDYTIQAPSKQDSKMKTTPAKVSEKQTMDASVGVDSLQEEKEEEEEDPIQDNFQQEDTDVKKKVEDNEEGGLVKIYRNTPVAFQKP